MIPAVRYHERWKDLKKEDFLLRQLETDTSMKGYCPRWNTVGRQSDIGGSEGEDGRKPD